MKKLLLKVFEVETLYYEPQGEIYEQKGVLCQVGDTHKIPEKVVKHNSISEHAIVLPPTTEFIIKISTYNIPKRR